MQLGVSFAQFHFGSLCSSACLCVHVRARLCPFECLAGQLAATHSEARRCRRGQVPASPTRLGRSPLSSLVPARRQLRSATLTHTRQFGSLQVRASTRTESRPPPDSLGFSPACLYNDRWLEAASLVSARPSDRLRPSGVVVAVAPCSSQSSTSLLLLLSLLLQLLLCCCYCCRACHLRSNRSARAQCRQWASACAHSRAPE